MVAKRQRRVRDKPELNETHEALNKMEARVSDLEARLKTSQASPASPSPIPAGISTTVMGPLPEKKWYLCPECKGKGEVPSDQRRRMMKGIMTFGYNICPICKGAKIIRADPETAAHDGLKPIVQCPLCKNWYAQGGGHPASETNEPPMTTGIGLSKPHSHWHDFSLVGGPPD